MLSFLEITNHINTFFLKANKTIVCPKQNKITVHPKQSKTVPVSNHYLRCNCRTILSMKGCQNLWVKTPLGGLSKRKKNFLREKIHSTDKVQWAFIRMEGDAMLWFQSSFLENLGADWETFT